MSVLQAVVKEVRFFWPAMREVVAERISRISFLHGSTTAIIIGPPYPARPEEGPCDGGRPSLLHSYHVEQWPCGTLERRQRGGQWAE